MPPQLPQPSQPPLPKSNGVDGHQGRKPEPCFVCGQNHPLGSCPLKLAGVEHCGLCGLAHYGQARTCPHLRSDVQVSRIIDALKQSTEDQHLVALAKKYCYGIKGDLAQRARRKSGKAAGSPADNAASTTAPITQQGASIAPPGQPVVDLTGYPSNGYANGQNPEHGSGTNDIEMYSALSNYLSGRK